MDKVQITKYRRFRAPEERYRGGQAPPRPCPPTPEDEAVIWVLKLCNSSAGENTIHSRPRQHNEKLCSALTSRANILCLHPSCAVVSFRRQPAGRVSKGEPCRLRRFLFGAGDSQEVPREYLLCAVRAGQKSQIQKSLARLFFLIPLKLYKTPRRLSIEKRHLPLFFSFRLAQGEHLCYTDFMRFCQPEGEHPDVRF